MPWDILSKNTQRRGPTEAASTRGMGWARNPQPGTSKKPSGISSKPRSTAGSRPTSSQGLYGSYRPGFSPPTNQRSTRDPPWPSRGPPRFDPNLSTRDDGDTRRPAVVETPTQTLQEQNWDTERSQRAGLTPSAPPTTGTEVHFVTVEAEGDDGAGEMTEEQRSALEAAKEARKQKRKAKRAAEAAATEVTTNGE